MRKTSDEEIFSLYNLFCCLFCFIPTTQNEEASNPVPSALFIAIGIIKQSDGNPCVVYLSADFIEASQQVWRPAFCVEADDGLEDLGVLLPVQRLQVVGRHDEKLLLTRDVGKEDDFLRVARFEQRPHGLRKRRKNVQNTDKWRWPWCSFYCMLPLDWHYLGFVSRLRVFLGGQVIVALTHAAVGDALQQLLPGLFRQILWICDGHSLRQALCDGQVLGDAQLQRLMVLCSWTTHRKKTKQKHMRAPARCDILRCCRQQNTFLAATSNSTALSYWEWVMKKSEQRARRAGSEFSFRSSAISWRAANCWVAKASSRALEK